MPEPQLSVRSARARDLAHMLAKRERRTIAQVVELALEKYARSEPAPPQQKSWAEFLDEISRIPVPPGELDIDLAEVAREGRVPHAGIDLE
ncbi:MAG: plasmid stabilization protein [Beijerinckiaceae bacterium]